MVQETQESFPGSPLVPALVSIAALLGSALLFLFCCYTAASDAQGAILFLLCSPVLVLAQVVAWIAGRLAQRRGHSLGMPLKWLGLAGLAFVIVFFTFASIRPLRPYSNYIVEGVAAVYESITGETPYDAVRKRK